MPNEPLSSAESQQSQLVKSGAAWQSHREDSSETVTL
jgi:hypothetical protein